MTVESSMWSPGEVEPALAELGPGWTAVFTRGITSTASSSLSVVLHCMLCWWRCLSSVGEGMLLLVGTKLLGTYVWSERWEEAQGTLAIARLRLDHTTLSATCTAYVCLVTPSALGVGLPLRPWNISYFSAHASTLNTLHYTSRLSALAITTLNLPTLLATLGIHRSWQPVVLRLTCAFLRKTSQLPRL
ncbi:hypothetical protein E2C01_049984 [Portunus trituberculatus]|uniref:Uncharacterized protein n=1 Tax=Portunus trituberculatus TaxID=210409 RepID=A0A5B7GF92_PORTR|nr:hypothetical protein [Portunus trituberculatus]